MLLSPEKPQEPFVSSKPSTSQANDSEVINFVSPSQFKGFPKATERKKKRKPCEKASSIIATDTNKSCTRIKRKEKLDKETTILSEEDKKMFQKVIYKEMNMTPTINFKIL